LQARSITFGERDAKSLVTTGIWPFHEHGAQNIRVPANCRETQGTLTVSIPLRETDLTATQEHKNTSERPAQYRLPKRRHPHIHSLLPQ
jgi:hypothetical protein